MSDSDMDGNHLERRIDISTPETWAADWLAKWQAILDAGTYAGDEDNFRADSLTGDLPWSDQNQHVCDLILANPAYPHFLESYKQAFNGSSLIDGELHEDLSDLYAGHPGGLAL